MENWSSLNTERREIWEDKARDLIYPDLRLGYRRHNDMIRELAKGLYKAHCLSLDGGGEDQANCEHIKSVLEV